MHLSEVQRMQEEFVRDRGWEKFPPSLVYVHLMEELGEIGRHILFREGYKAPGLGHKGGGRELKSEFAQVLSLLLQLASFFKVNLEEAVLDEVKHMEKRFDKKAWRGYMKTYGKRRAKG